MPLSKKQPAPQERKKKYFIYRTDEQGREYCRITEDWQEYNEYLQRVDKEHREWHEKKKMDAQQNLKEKFKDIGKE